MGILCDMKEEENGREGNVGDGAPDWCVLYSDELEEEEEEEDNRRPKGKTT
jgi:hypothetical protein